MNDRGVSEVIAFILVFSIVITSVGLLYTAGFGSITQIQETETDRSAERAFGASAIALEDIQRGRGEHRAVDLELSGRSLSIDDSQTLEVTVGGSTTVDASGTLIYGSGSDTQIVYQSGAVIRSDGPDAQIVSREPMFRCTSDRAVLTLVTITGPDTSVSTDGSIQIQADGPESDESTLVATDTSGSTSVTVDYGGNPYATAWERYFEDRDWDAVSSTDATCNVDEVYVRNVPIELEYLGV